MMGGRWAAALAVCLTTAPACRDGDAELYEGESGRPIPASFEGWVPAVDAELGDLGTGHFLLDTGAPVTLADTDDFSDLSPGWYELALQLGNIRFRGPQVGAFDVFTYEQGRQRPFTGIIGGDNMSSFALSLDYQNQRVWLEDGASAELPDGLEAGAVGEPIEIGARIEGGGRFSVAGETRPIGASRFLVAASVEDQDDETGEFWLLIDTGATSVVLSNRLVERLGDHGRPRLDGVPVGTAAGEQTAYLTRVWSLRLPSAGGGGSGRVEQASVPVLVLPDDGLFESISHEVGADVSGVAGGMLLRYYMTTLDYPGHVMRLLPYTSTDHIDPAEFIGVGFELAPAAGPAGEWLVQAVFPGTDAEAKGLMAGDAVAELAGVPVAGLSRAEVQALVTPFGLGDALPVGVARGGGVEDLAVAVEDLLPSFEAPR